MWYEGKADVEMIKGDTCFYMIQGDEDMEEIRISGDDLRRIRDLLRDYYGTAMTGAFPMAMADLNRVDSMTDQELVDEALRLGIISIK